MITCLVAAVLFIVVSLAVVVRRKAGRESRSIHEDTTAANPAYGVTQTLQDAHTPGKNTYYDYPTINTHNISETRMNEAHGVIYETIAAGHGESVHTYSHPVAQFQAGTDGNHIEAKQNEAYAVIADVIMEKNDAYNI